MVESMQAQQQGDAQAEARALAQLNRLKQQYPEMGLVTALVLGTPKMEDYTEEQLATFVAGVRKYENDPDALASLAYMLLTGSHGVEIDFDKAIHSAITLLALTHLVHSVERAEYLLAYDDALKAYAESHPELAGIATTLRFLALSYWADNESSNSPETDCEIHARLEELAAPMLTAEHSAFLRAHNNREAVVRFDNRRAGIARKGAPLLREQKADIVVMVDREVAVQAKGEGADALRSFCSQNADVLKGADLLLRHVDPEMAEIAAAARVRSVTALTITVEARTYLRSRGIAAGGYEIIP